MTDKQDEKKPGKYPALPPRKKDPLLILLHRIIRLGVRILSVLMVLVIFWGIGDVVWVIFERLRKPPLLVMTIDDILATFGAFLAVLIAIEIFENITFYLRDDIIHVQLVVDTALMAIARKVIVFDFNELKPEYIWATAAVILALAVTKWLIPQKQEKNIRLSSGNEEFPAKEAERSSTDAV